MDHFDLTLSNPAENLALDEALLDFVEQSECQDCGFLRFWESPVYFVVLGLSKSWKTEVVPATTSIMQGKTPIYRRASGGGTVLQGPGCLNYTLILRMDQNPALSSITSTNQYILQRNMDSISILLDSPLSQQGATDVVWQGRKCSGNAQKRKRKTLMFHGTWLYSFDLKLIPTVLSLPKDQPDYRAGRTHLDFLTNLPLSAAQLRSALSHAWQSKPAPPPDLLPQVQDLLRSKYENPQWITRM